MKSILLFLLLFQGLLLCAQEKKLLDSREKICYNAKIFTADNRNPYAEAVAIRDGKIVAVGGLEKVSRSVSAKAVRINMQGAYIFPGLIDSHSHALDGGADMMHANLNDSAQSPGDIVAYAHKSWKDQTGLVGRFLVINGINISNWSQLVELAEAFNKDDFASQAVLLNGSDGHTHWGNKAMMEAAGLDKNFLNQLPPITRKYYGTLDDGTPNGFVADSGFVKYNMVIPIVQADAEKAAKNAMDYNNGYGITAWLDPAAGNIKDARMNDLEEYFSLATRHRLRAHVAAVVVADANADPTVQVNRLKSLENKYNTTKDFQVIGFKIFADGVVEYPTQTAALSKPYTNSTSTGALMFEPAKFARFVTAADKSGLLVHVHAIGDRAVTETLRGFATARKINGNSGIPHTITHLQFVQPADIPLFSSLHILASMQLMWALGDVTTIDIIKPFIDPEIYSWQYPARSLLQSGAILCGASDWPVSSANPFEAIYEAETRNGQKGVLDASQCVPRLAMLYAYTINAAKALRMDNMAGSIEPGKSADMIRVDRDVLTISPEAMHGTKVLWTMFEGKIVYTAGQ